MRADLADAAAAWETRLVVMLGDFNLAEGGVVKERITPGHTARDARLCHKSTSPANCCTIHSCSLLCTMASSSPPPLFFGIN